MASRLHPGDEQNGSFEPASRRLQNLKPGIESGQPRQKAGEGGVKRRVRRGAKDISRESLAQRIREREGR
jgi:hypothetical protein